MKNLELRKIKEPEVVEKLGLSKKVNLSKLTVKNLQDICSKSLNEDGTPKIPNYTRISKPELVKKMTENYEFLVLTW